jgi:peroxiredoxin
MRFLVFASGLLVLSLAAPVVGQVASDDSPGDAAEARERLAALVQSHRDARDQFFREYRATAGDGARERAALGRYRDVIDRATGEAMRLARVHAQEPLAADALRFVAKAGQAGRMGDPRPHESAAQALKILRRDHVGAPGMGEFCEEILMNTHDPVAESLIRGVLERHPDHDQRGLACHALAVFIRQQAAEIRWLLGRTVDRDAREESPDDARKSFEDAWGKDVVDRYLMRDPEALDAEADALLERVIAEFGSVPHGFGTKPSTLAALADAELFEHRDLAVGKAAPEIEGKDHEGVAFRLSDYRGRVVLLTFSGNWCGPCRALYPQERDLVERFKDRPFVLLSINTDEERDTLRASIASGEITWRCWWDGRTGPITRRWGVMQFPSLFLLDRDGVIRAKPLSQSKRLARDVAALLEESGAKPTP